MTAVHANLYKALNAYVDEACAGRDESHGLFHMRLVTDNAVTIFMMTVAQEAAADLAARLTTTTNTTASSDTATSTAAELASVEFVLNVLANGVRTDDSTAALPPAESFVEFTREFLKGPQTTVDETGLATVPQPPKPLSDALLNLSVTHSDGAAKEDGSAASPSFLTLAVLWARLVVTYAVAARGVVVDSLLTETTTTQLFAPIMAYFDLTAATNATTSTTRSSLTSGVATAAAFHTALGRVLTIAMLHDVNDHKYERPDGSLSKGLRAFVEGTLAKAHNAEEETKEEGAIAETDFCDLLFPNDGTATATAVTTDSDRTETIMKTISAISFSKEKKGGKRYFVPLLGPLAWTFVRDWVSDADKIEAIGESGVMRCWHYGYESEEGAMGKDAMALLLADPERKEALRQLLYKHVVEHTDEKLGLLKDEYINTIAGKRLAEKHHAAMYEMLAVWEREGPPQI